MKFDKNKIEIVSDVHDRDGIGIEFYTNSKLKIEIFRDDSMRFY